MADYKLGVGIVGLGIGSLHLQGYLQCPDAKVIALCDVDEARARKVADENGIPHVFTSYEEMLKLEEVQAVSVCTPNFLHAPITLAAFAAGKHVICEKPLAMKPEEAEAMVAAGKKAGKVFMVAFNNRFRDDTRAMKEYIEAGKMGEIYYAKTGWIRRKGAPGMGGWFTTKAKSGGGALIDIGVHVLDLALWLMGNPKPIAVSGSTFMKFGHLGRGASAWGLTADNKGTFDVDDLACALIKLDNGATLFLEASWVSHIKEDLIYTQVMGTEGGGEIAPLTIYTDVDGRSADIKPYTSELSGHIEEIKHFVDCVVNGKEPISTGEQGLQITRILDAIYKSAETGKEVVLG
jgi:predicted dehydrogenase